MTSLSPSLLLVPLRSPGKSARVEAARKINEFFVPDSGHVSLPAPSPAHTRVDAAMQTMLTSGEIDRMETKVDREELTSLQEVSSHLLGNSALLSHKVNPKHTGKQANTKTEELKCWNADWRRPV